jgi:hypothetical protein
MKKAYLLVYDSFLGNRDEVKDILNHMYMIDKWRYDMPNSFYIISEYSAEQIAKEIRKITGDKGKFIVSELQANSYGWLTKESWYLIQNKEYKP